MKITHKNLKIHGERIRLPVDYLKISDPMYDKDVVCRYEKDNLQMSDILVALKHQHVDVPENGCGFEFGELIVVLSDRSIHGKEIETREYNIGVDSAEYVFETEHGSTQIQTAADGLWGCVVETYYDGKLGETKITLSIPEANVMSEEEFIESIMSTMRLHDMQFVEVVDMDVNIDVSERTQEEAIEMNILN